MTYFFDLRGVVSNCIEDESDTNEEGVGLSCFRIVSFPEEATETIWASTERLIFAESAF